MKIPRYVLILLSFATLMLSSSPSLATTYTYLRCFYQIDPSPAKPATAYVWGRNLDDDDYYRVYGDWYSRTSTRNMFFSDTSQDTMTEICKSTFKKQGIERPVVMHAAADTKASLNYTVWSHDLAEQGKKINKIVAFGDSLSDTQNIFNASSWLMLRNNSYFAGRFSNGKNWLDYVSDDLHLPVYNWATGGAGAYDYYVALDYMHTTPIPGVTSQVNSWKEYMNYAKHYDPENTLFTVFIGENDLGNYGRLADDVIKHELEAVMTLIGAGAKNILLFKLPDVSLAPIFSFRSKGEARAASVEVQRFNYKLNEMAEELKKIYGRKINLQIFDTDQLVEALMEKPAEFGVTNTTKSCLDINSDSTMNYLYEWPTRAGDAEHPENNCSDPDTFAFWDLLHPTTHAHRLMAYAITSTIEYKFAAQLGYLP